MPTPKPIAIAAPFAFCCFLACGHSLERKVDLVVTQSLSAFNENSNRAELQSLLTSEEFVGATRELSRSVLETFWEDLASNQRSEQIQGIAASFVEDLTPAVSDLLDQHVWPSVREELHSAVALVLDQVLSDQNLERLADVAGQLAGEALAATQPGVTTAIAEGVSTGLERGVRSVFEEVFLPALQSLGEQELAVEEIVRKGARGALLGAADAMDGEFGRVFDRERDELIHQLQSSAEESFLRFKRRALWLGFGAVALFGVTIWWYQRRTRLRDQAIDTLTRAVRRGRAADLDELAATVRESAPAQVEALLDDRLRRAKNASG